MDVHWVPGAVLTVVQHRQEAAKAWDKILALLLGNRKKIAITGMAGAGKTVLFDYLSGKAYQPGYAPPLTSQAVETGSLPAKHKRIGLSVVPGQLQPHYEGLDSMLGGKDPVDGIIHVVTSGFVSVRGKDAEAALVHVGIDTIEKLQKYQAERELEDLAETCQYIRDANRKHRKPSWMIVAIDKVDLYHADLDQIRKSYSQHGVSPFGERIKKLTSQVGTDNIRWEAVPVCAWLTDFEYNGTKVPSGLKPDTRDAFVSQFARVVESYCEP